MSVPHVEQKKLVILFPEETVLAWPQLVRFSWPRRCLRYLSSTVKLDANMEAVTLRQSAQLHTKVLMRPGPWVGCGGVRHVLNERACIMTRWYQTYKC